VGASEIETDLQKGTPHPLSKHFSFRSAALECGVSANTSLSPVLHAPMHEL
jgi:hypothetical protein